jgi:hypothetical protein
MFRKMVIAVLVIIFTCGTLVIASGASASQEKNPLQSMYDWFSGVGKPAEKAAECCCKTCGKQCCKICNTDCGGKCCSNCCAKK